MKTNKTISARLFKGLCSLVIITFFLLNPNENFSQTIIVDPINTIINNNGNGFADNFDYAGNVTGNNASNFFSTNVNGFDYFSWSHFMGSEGFFISYARFNNDSYVRIKGDSLMLMEIDWQNYSKVSCNVESGYLANANNILNFSIILFISPGGGYSIGDSIKVYYNYEICSSGLTKHEAGNEDQISSNNSFKIKGIEQAGPWFSFNNPPGLSGWNLKEISDAFYVKVGDIFKIQVSSNMSDFIATPPKVWWPWQQDRSSAHFWGKLQLGINPIIVNPLPVASKMLLSLDIGSDTERSDPFADGDEVFDPGDAYIFRGPLLPPTGANGIIDDKSFFIIDPWPIPTDPATAAPCGAGLLLEPSSYFDLDGMDNIQTSLLNCAYGPGNSSITQNNDSLVYIACNFMISYDDDESTNYTESNGAVPVNSFSPFMMDTLGQTKDADEVIAVDFDAFNIPSPGFSLDSLYDEEDVHISMGPNPDNIAEDDDDVDALDYFWDENLSGIYYFSPDHEATSSHPLTGLPLNGGSIYEVDPNTNEIIEVVNCVVHLGIIENTDIDAFEFGWVWDNDAGRLGLALLFSVDDDDLLTPNDESGGLDPAMIYYSFLNGISYEFSVCPLDDDIDAIALCDHSFNGWVNLTCSMPTNLSASNITDISAQLDWTPGGSETSWNIEYGSGGFILGTGTLISGIGNPYLLTGLTPSTTYDFYVQADCGGGSLSTWAGPCTFTTLYSCNYTIELWDDYGDGWNGGFLDVYVDGNLVLNGITLVAGYGPLTYSLPVNTGSLIQFDYTAGGWAYENYYYVYDSFGALVFDDGVGGVEPLGGTLTGDCGEVLDFGDAPDPLYPTLLANDGARHIIDTLVYLGMYIDGEPDGWQSPDALGDNNNNLDDEDGIIYTSFIQGQMSDIVVIASAIGFLNAWIDFDGDGSWADTDEQIFTDVPVVSGTNVFSFNVPLSAVVGTTISRFRFNTTGCLTYNGLASDGEVEDYEIYIDNLPSSFSDYGDAPELAIAYPSSGVNGTFPTCRTVGVPNSYIKHGGGISNNAWFGPLVDFETDGNAGACPACFPSYDLDECFNDGDAGLITPASYTIDATNTVVPCQGSGGDSLGVVCNLAIWGIDIDIDVTNNLYDPAYVNVLIDWNQDGQWHNDPNTVCGYSVVQEHVLVDFEVPLNHTGALSVLNPPNFRIGPNSNNVWVRFSITDYEVGTSNWDGSGVFEDGETEDYLLLVDIGEPDELDFGDAPDSYKTLNISDGPKHLAGVGTYMGNLIDAEYDGLPDPFALGDNLDNLDDEDGVKFLTSLVAGKDATFNVELSTDNGLLNAWIDFDGNGDFAAANEHVVVELTASAGSLDIVIPIPASALIGETYARFRYSTQSNLDYFGPATDGEVEDYKVFIHKPVEHKMHFPQYPEMLGWDVNFTVPNVLADDWMCSMTGPVQDIHFWISMLGDIGAFELDACIDKIFVAIHADIPASESPTGYSMPADPPLWESVFVEGEYTWNHYFEFPQGWYSPYDSIVQPNDHYHCFQININDTIEPFIQEEGTIYWLRISMLSKFPDNFFFGWKSAIEQWNDNGVYNYPFPNYLPDDWMELYQPMDTAQSMDLAFNINHTGTPSGGHPLNVGYQFVSTRLIPYAPNMLNVLANNLPNLDFVRNTAGLMLRKIGPVWVNNIGDWITTEGYLFKMNYDDELFIYGNVINPQTPIDLVTGYQIISYLPGQPMNTSNVFAGVLTNLEFVRNSDGLMFRKIGPVWVNNIGDMNPGEGYLVKMTNNDQLIYPLASDNVSGYKTATPNHYKVVDGNPYDPVWTIYFEANGLEAGDEIAVYDGEVLVGAGITNSNDILTNSIPVFGNVFESGNTPIFKLWDMSENKELLLAEYSYLNPYGDAYTGKVFPTEDGEYSMLNYSITGISDEITNNPLLSIYPNPSEGKFNILIEGIIGDVTMKVIDLRGKEHLSFEFEGIISITNTQLDLKGLPTGVYFINFSGNNFNQVKKIVIR